MKAFSICWTAQYIYTHREKLRPSGLAFWKKGKYVADLNIDHNNVYNFEMDLESKLEESFMLFM